MAKLVLLNSILDQTAGNKFDEAIEAVLIERLRSSGGVFVADGEFTIAESAALRAVRAGAGANDAAMVAAASEGALTRGKTNTATINILDWSTAYALHVNKSGDDANSGTNPARAFKTIGAAMAKATSLIPAADNRIAIYIDDAGAYVEDVNVIPWVGVIGNASLIQGNHTITDNSLLRSFRIVATSGIAVSKTTGAESATVDSPRMVLTGSANGLTCTGGTVNYYGQQIAVENGVGVGNTTTGSINADVNLIEISGTGTGVGMSSSGEIHFSGSIEGSGACIGIDAGGTSHVGVVADHIDCPAGVAWDVSIGAELHLLAAKVDGLRQGIGTKNITVAGELEQQSQELIFTSPLTGVTANIFNFIGEFRTVTTGQTGSYAVGFQVSNHHAMFNVNALTGSGTLTITGASMSEASGIPLIGDTEIITVDATGRYQSTKKWWEITGIVAAGFTAINYNIEIIGYPDLGNRNFRIIGYRIEAIAGGPSPDLGIDMWKVQDDGAKKMTLVPFESIGVDANNGTYQIVDGLRVAATRRFQPSVGAIWVNGQTLCFKQIDFDTYFTGDEVNFESATKAEGFVVRVRGEDGAGGGGISNVTTLSLWLRVSTIV